MPAGHVTQVADQYLRRFVVRVQDADGGSLGSGVLVAPGWVLTCAHVVQGLDLVRVVPDAGAAGEMGREVPEFVNASVAARSAERDGTSESAFWPPPDLALMRMDGWTDHVCAPLIAAAPAGGSEPHAWGFARREDGVSPVGSPASFTFVGVEGDGFLSLKAGAAPPGLSGAPLVCTGLRGVVAVMSVSRDPAQDRGGWASPVSALADGLGGTGGQLGEPGRELIRLNRDAAWRSRDDWALALPVLGAHDLVDRFWDGSVVNPARGQPSTMLRAEFLVVPYLFREEHLDGIRSWCSEPDRFSIRYIEAAGGAGKTRFAIQACRAQEQRGWIAGMEPAADRGGDTLSVPKLLVVDYVEERNAEALVKRLDALSRHATTMAPVRVLLLARPAAGALAGEVLQPLLAEASGAAMTALDAASSASSATASLTLAQRRELFGEALGAFGRTWHGPSWVLPSIRNPLADSWLTEDRYARPLDVLFEAFDAALTGAGWTPDGRPPVDRVLDHETRHWKTRMPAADVRVLRIAVALATAAGARSQAEADALLDILERLAGENVKAARPAIDGWLRGLYAGAGRWNPLEPDRLGEALVSQVMRDFEDSGLAFLTSLLALESPDQVARVLETVVRLGPYVATAGQPPSAEATMGALVAKYRTLVDRAAAQAHGSTERPGSAQLIDALSRAHAAVLTEDRVADLPLGVQATISAAADVLGDLANAHGRSTLSLAIFTTALRIDERKQNAEPGNTTYRRDVSVSYNKLADLALAAGRSGDAEALYRQSLAVREELTELEPGNTTYRRDLSVSYERLADLALAAGRSGDAEALYRQSLAVAQELTELEPGNTTYRRDLSISYNKLADLALAAGRSGDAEALYRQSLAVREELTELEPGNTTYRRDLSVSYERLADLALAAGRSGDAEALYRQSLAVAQELTELEPGNTTYRRDLSISYNKLADLALAAGRSGDAEALYRQSLAVREELTELEPGNTTYRRDLSVSYERLADLALAAGRSGDAEALYRQSLAVAQELTELEPGNTTYRRDLSISYNKLADLALAAGRSGDAEALYRQSLAVREELTELEPGNTTYRRDLSVSYERLADLALAAGRSGDAEALYRQSLAVREELTELEPGNTTYRRDLSVSYERLADLALAAGRSGDAEALYRQSLAVREELTELEPGNTTYRRDVSVSLDKLADLALAAGRSGDAEALYRQSLAVREELTELEPGNTTYRRDLSVSYERMAAVAAESGRVAEAGQFLVVALNTRRALLEGEPQRADLAEELSYAVYLNASIYNDQAGAAQQEVRTLLEPFEQAGTISLRGASLLSWARQSSAG